MSRPFPPEHIGRFVEGDQWPESFIPAPEVLGWAANNFIKEGAPLENPDHSHLRMASIAFLWAAGGFEKQGRLVLGQCEELTFRCSPWQRGRQEQQIARWFGYIPDFLITLAADHCASCSDAEFCSLVEHELYHIGQATTPFGVPKFTAEGTPKLCMRGHDVEEFVGVVRRYGPNASVSALVKAANQPPEVARINVARACGTCLLKSA